MSTDPTHSSTTTYGRTPLAHVPTCGSLFATHATAPLPALQASMRRAITHFAAAEQALYDATDGALGPLRDELYDGASACYYGPGAEARRANVKALIAVCEEVAEGIDAERSLWLIEDFVGAVAGLGDGAAGGRAGGGAEGMGDGGEGSGEGGGTEGRQRGSKGGGRKAYELCGMLHERFGKILDWQAEYADAQWMLEFRS